MTVMLVRACRFLLGGERPCSGEREREEQLIPQMLAGGGSKDEVLAGIGVRRSRSRSLSPCSS